MFIGAKDDAGGGDNWTTGATSRAKLQSNHHHQQTNIQFFYRPDRMPFLSPIQQCQSTEGKISHSMDLLTPSSPEGLPTLSLTTNSSWGFRNIRSQDYSFPGTFVPMMELSFSGPFVPWNFRSRDRSFPGTFNPWTIRSLELSFPGPFQGTYVPRNEWSPRTKVPSWERMFQGTNSLGNEYSSIRSWFPWGRVAMRSSAL